MLPGRRQWTAMVFTGALITTWAGAAVAEEFSSQYTSTNVKKCRKVGTIKVDDDSEFGASWACRGVAGYVVVVSEVDLRTTVSVGKTVKEDESEHAASKGFGTVTLRYGTVD